MFLDVDQMLNGVTCAGNLLDRLYATGLFKKKSQLRACRSLIIDNQGMQQLSVLISLRAAQEG